VLAQNKYYTISQYTHKQHTTIIIITITTTIIIIKKLQKTTILGTAHILLKAEVKVQYSTFNIANSVICTMNSNYRIAATLYSIETWFVWIHK
jgi:hypothetical protein